MRGLIFIIIFVSLSVNAQTFKSSEVLVEAQSSFMRGDLFNANRFYTLLYEKTPQALAVSDIESFLIAKEHLNSKADLVMFCKENSEKSSIKIEIRFFCAKALMNSEMYIDAAELLEKIPKSYQRLEYHFLKATLFLKLNKTAQCLNEVDEAQKKITDKTSDHFKDLVKVISARCLLNQSRYDEAVAQFQSLSVSSDFYVTTLEEQAWAHFKNRNLTSARDVIKIILSYFSSQSIKNQIFGADVYFRIKYLQGYIELISQNREKSKDLFAALSDETKKFKKDHFSQSYLPKDLKDKLQNLKSYSQLLNKEYDFLSKYRDFIQTWSSLSTMKSFDREIRYLVALNNETQRLSLIKNSDLVDYKSKILDLKNTQVRYIQNIFSNYFLDSRRAIDSIEFKSGMGQVENYWADRTEGKRTLAEVLDSYKEQASYLEDYIGK